MLLAVAAVAVGCVNEEESGSQGPPTPFGTTAWGSDECLYTWVSPGVWVKGIYCRRRISDAITDIYAAGTIRYRYDETDARYFQYYDYFLDHWYAQDRESGVLYIKTADGRLLTPFAYWQEQARPQQGAASPGTAPSTATPVGGTGSVPQGSSSGGVPYWQVQQAIDEMNNRIISRILAPDCAGSYNGCR